MSTPPQRLNTDSDAPSSEPVSNPVEDTQVAAIDTESKPWAVVLVGRSPGVFFKGGEALQASIISIPGSMIVKYEREDDARKAYLDALAAEKVVRVTIIHTRSVVVESPEEPLAICADNPAVTTWRAVFIGREPGVFPDKKNILENTLHIPGGHTQKFETYTEAVDMFRALVKARHVTRVHFVITREVLGTAEN